MMNRSKWPTFDGRAEEYELWEERMLCCMHGVGLKQTILTEPSGPLTVGEKANDDKLNADAYCALAPLLGTDIQRHEGQGPREPQSVKRTLHRKR